MAINDDELNKLAEKWLENAKRSLDAVPSATYEQEQDTNEQVNNAD